MRNVLICTVGTSLKNNLKSASDPFPFQHLETGNLKALSLWLKGMEPADRVCGAEINSNHSILKKGLIGKRGFLYLLTSDTEEGRLIGQTLEELLQTLGQGGSIPH